MNKLEIKYEGDEYWLTKKEFEEGDKEFIIKRLKIFIDTLEKSKYGLSISEKFKKEEVKNGQRKIE